MNILIRHLALSLCALMGTLPSTGTFAQQVTTDSALAQQATAIMQNRCMVCHGCYDAPCQLKLEAHEGLRRGASKDRVYDGSRLVATQMTRLFDDGFTEQQWRDKGFYPVLDTQRPDQGVMRRMLELKQTHPLPARGSIPDGFDLSLDREQQCPKQEEFDKFAQDYPLWGMPYALPGLHPAEHRTIVDWLARGAPAPTLAPLGRSVQTAIGQWEEFLNGDSNKEKLMSRYLYEHLFLAGLYFDEAQNPAWFRLVRSHTPPGRNIDLISSRRPYDDPRTSEFYYRLQRMPITVLDKRHMPYRFDKARMDHYRRLFLAAEYEVQKLPGYEHKLAANPFKTFRAIPVRSRYEFLLEEAQFSIMNFIKGPVCRGEIALDVIEDHFWVMFTDPARIDPEHDAQFLAEEADNLRLPTASTGTPVDLLTWKRYARAEERFLSAKSDYMSQQLDGNERRLDIDAIWDGDGRNDNAALTIFRHFDSASVVKGFVGDTPKTAWVVGYALLERIHYLLVAGYDVFGGVSHQLESRLYMDFLRMEGEFNFLMFMPPENRTALVNEWYRGSRKSIKDHFFTRSAVFQREGDVTFTSDKPKEELLQRMRQKIYGATATPYDYRVTASEPMVAAFEQLEQNVGAHNSYMPQVSFVNVIGGKRDEAYTIVRNAGYSNIAQVFQEQKRRLVEEDNLTVVRGFIGAYPNSFFQVNEKQVPLFAEDVAKLASTQDYEQLLDRYGVRRNAPWFWHVSDKFQKMYRQQASTAAGLFDYNRYHPR